MTSSFDLNAFLKERKDDPFDLIHESWTLEDDKFLESIRYGGDGSLQDDDLDDFDMSDDGVNEEVINLEQAEIITYSIDTEEQLGSPSSHSSAGSSSSDLYDDHHNVEVLQLVGILPHGVNTIQIVQQDDNSQEEMNGMDDTSSVGSSPDQNASYQELKLSDEERRLLSKEGISLPAHYPLTKYEERELKRIRRKIRNKISAQDSRKRKKEYLDKLQQKIQEVEEERNGLSKKVKTLETANAKLISQVKRLQAVVAQNNNSAKPSNSLPGGAPGRQNAAAATTLLVLILSLAIVVLPQIQGKKPMAPSGAGLENAVMTAFEDGNPNMSIAGRSRTMVGVGVPMQQKRRAGAYKEYNDLADMDEPLIKIPRFSFQTPGMKAKSAVNGLQDAFANEINVNGVMKAGGIKAGSMRPFHGDIGDLD